MLLIREPVAGLQIDTLLRLDIFLTQLSILQYVSLKKQSEQCLNIFPYCSVYILLQFLICAAICTDFLRSSFLGLKALDYGLHNPARFHNTDYIILLYYYIIILYMSPGNKNSEL